MVAKERYTSYGTFLAHWASLIRFRSPTGTALLLLPCYAGMAAAASSDIARLGVQSQFFALPFYPVGFSVLFAAGAFTMRSAGCIVNDMWDKDIDRQVWRTRYRPLASGCLSFTQGYAILSVHLILGMAVVLCLDPLSLGLALASVPLAALYPLAKRYLNCPQFILGLCFNSGVYIAHTSVLGEISWSTSVPIVLPLYSAFVIWTVIYDTVYAFQDAKDDRTLGIGSFALYLGCRKTFLYFLLLPMGFLFMLAGWNANQHRAYFGILLFSMAYLTFLLSSVRAGSPGTCSFFFRRMPLVGALFVLSWTIGNILNVSPVTHSFLKLNILGNSTDADQVKLTENEKKDFEK